MTTARSDTRSRSPDAAVLEIDTPHGPARAHLQGPVKPIGALVLGHGAGGGVSAPDLVAVTEVARSAGFSVARIEQPYRVAGRRSPAPAHQLDESWIVAIDHLRSRELRALALIVGGRSSGARVACRTVGDTGAVAVLCLAFPLHPPGRPEKTRQPELDAVRAPVLVVQGARDPFGIPAARADHTVVTVSGNHSLKGDLDTVTVIVRDWLARITAGLNAKPSRPAG